MVHKVVHIVFETGWFFAFLPISVTIPVALYYVRHPKEFIYDLTHDDYDPSKDCSGRSLN